MIQLETTKAYDLGEAAEILHRNRDTVRRYIKSGRLKAQKVGRSYFITERALMELITGEAQPMPER